MNIVSPHASQASTLHNPTVVNRNESIMTEFQGLYQGLKLSLLAKTIYIDATTNLTTIPVEASLSKL